MSDIITDIDIIREHLRSYSAKSRNNFKWAEGIADHIDLGYNVSNDYIENIDLNSNLFRGKGVTHKQISKFVGAKAKQMKDIRLATQEISHMDILGVIGNSMDGIQRKRPFEPMVIDTGPIEGNERRSKHLELVQRYMQEQVIPRYQEQAMMNIFQKYGIEDPMQLDPEDQMQVQKEIGEETERLTPERIQEYMDKDFRSLRTQQLSGLLDVLIQELDLKFVTDEGFQMSLISGIEAYYIGIRGGQLVFDLVNPKGLIYGDYDSCRWIQESMWVKYTDQLPIVEVIKRYGDELTRTNIKDIKDTMTGYGSREKYDNARLVGMIGDSKILDDIELRRIEEQFRYKNIQHDFGIGARDAFMEVKHIVFQSIDSAKFVKRVVNGEVRGFYVGRDYEINKLKGDISVKDIKVPQIFEVTKIETGKGPIYVNKGQIPYSYKSAENPFSVELPYVGATYNKMKGNGEIVSQIDLGKPGQYKYNVTYAKMEREETAEFGKVLSLVLSLKPSTYETEQWIRMIRDKRVLLIGEENSPTGHMDPNMLQAIRQLDLTTTDKIASYLSKLEAIKRDTAEAMRFNSAMLGQASPYDSVANRQADLQLSSNQTENLYNTHDKIVEKALTYLMQTAKVYYKDRPLKRSWIMTDSSIASMELDPDLIHSSEVGVFLSISTRDLQNAEAIKTESHALIQGEQIDVEDWIRFRTARSMSELANIGRQATRKKQQAMQMQIESAREEAEATRAFQMQLKEFDRETLLQKTQMETDRSIITSDMRADQFRRGYDIDQNSINDANQRLEMQLEYNREKDEKDREIELLKLRIEEKRLELEKIKAESGKNN